MTALAVNGIDGLEASDVELAAPGTSYTADTLDRFHAAGLRASQIFFITRRRRVRRNRDLEPLPAGARSRATSWWSRGRASTVGAARRAHVRRWPARMARPASGRRHQRRCGRRRGFSCVTAATPDVSSTDIRRRLRAGESIAGLVPDGVERHIRQHGSIWTADRQPHSRGRSLAWPKLNDERRAQQETTDGRSREGGARRARQESARRRRARPPPHAGVHRLLRAVLRTQPAAGEGDRRRRRGGAPRREGPPGARRRLRPRRVDPDGLLHVHRPRVLAADARVLLAGAAMGRC